jgi:DNA repair photolyase
MRRSSRKMSYRLFKPDRFLCEPELSSFAFSFKGPTVEFANPATAPGIAGNTTIPGRYYLAKTIAAFTVKPGLKVERAENRAGHPADYEISWVYGCPHHCAYCPHIYLCRNYPYVAICPDIGRVEEAVRRIASEWKKPRHFIVKAGGLTDILAFEHLTGWLSRLVCFFANEIAPHGQLTFVTRSANFRPLAELNHRRAARIGVFLAPENQIGAFEPGSASLAGRLNLISQAVVAGYPLHISFSPVMLVEKYEREYDKLFHKAATALVRAGSPEMGDVTIDVELLSVKPESEVVTEELTPHVLDGLVSRKVEGRASLVYPEHEYAQALRHFRRVLPQYFPTARIVSIR